MPGDGNYFLSEEEDTLRIHVGRRKYLSNDSKNSARLELHAVFGTTKTKYTKQAYLHFFVSNKRIYFVNQKKIVMP